jgi:hypothetical protein
MYILTTTKKKGGHDFLCYPTVGGHAHLLDHNHRSHIQREPQPPKQQEPVSASLQQEQADQLSPAHDQLLVLHHGLAAARHQLAVHS